MSLYADIVWKFICKDETKYKKLPENLRKKKIFQYIFPVVYCNSEQHGFDLKSESQIKFNEYKDKKNSIARQRPICL